MATAEARTTLFNSVFMSATVCRTVDSKVASSMTSTPAFACPRATRPSRLKISDRNAIVLSPLRSQIPQHATRHEHVHQQEVDAGKDVVFILRPHVLQHAKVIQRDGYFAAAGFIKLKVRCGNAVIGF